jgi:hypothetical protein
MIGLFVVAPMLVGLCFAMPWWIVASLTVAIAVPWLWYAMSPVRLTVTREGYFIVHRPALPGSGDFGRLEDLELELHATETLSGEAVTFRCDVDHRKHEIFRLEGLTPKDVTLLRAFEERARSLESTEPEPHLGGYREAS